MARGTNFSPRVWSAWHFKTGFVGSVNFFKLTVRLIFKNPVDGAFVFSHLQTPEWETEWRKRRQHDEEKKQRQTDCYPAWEKQEGKHHVTDIGGRVATIHLDTQTHNTSAWAQHIGVKGYGVINDRTLTVHIFFFLVISTSLKAAEGVKQSHKTTGEDYCTTVGSSIVISSQD